MTSGEKYPTTITTPGDTKVQIERVFDAPPDVLWDYYTDPELLSQWLGPHRLAMTVQEMDVRPGGSYRFTHHDTDGGEYVFFGEYREVTRPEVLEWTFNFEGAPGTSIDRNEFQGIDGGRTRLLITSTLDSKESRDAMLESGMEVGVREGYEKLDELLASRQA